MDVGVIVSAPSVRDVRRHLEYARALAGPPRTEASLNSELDRPEADRSTLRDPEEPPVVQLRRAVASMGVVLEYALALIEWARSWAPWVAVVAVVLLCSVSLSLGASIGAAVAVYGMRHGVGL